MSTTENEVTVLHRLRLRYLHTDEFINFLDDAKIFSTLNAYASYGQIKMDEDAGDKTAFVTHHGLFMYKRVLFGLKNAPATFECAMNAVLASVRWQHVVAYLDDFVVFSITTSHHIEQAATGLKLMKRARPSLTLKKCFFLQTLSTTLGVRYVTEHWNSRRKEQTPSTASIRQQI